MQAENLVALPTRPGRRSFRIQRSRGRAPVDLREMWRFRELLFYLVWRDIKARYRQTFLGPAWAILRPLVSMVLISAIFGGLAGIKPGTDIPYPLFVYPALLVWGYFSSCVTGGSGSLLSSAGLISKAYFPRLFAPLAAVTAPLVDMGLSFLIVFGLFAYYERVPSWHLVFLPAFTLLALGTGLGIGLLLAGLTVRFRDVQFALPYITQLWMYATPVIYPVSLVPQQYRWLLAINPMTAVVEGFRWCVTGDVVPSPWIVAISAGTALVLVVVGLFAFRRTERTIVDSI
jgi:lipopolysaccharide transport system permease protein